MYSVLFQFEYRKFKLTIEKQKYLQKRDKGSLAATSFSLQIISNKIQSSFGSKATISCLSSWVNLHFKVLAGDCEFGVTMQQNLGLLKMTDT